MNLMNNPTLDAAGKLQKGIIPSPPVSYFDAPVVPSGFQQKTNCAASRKVWKKEPAKVPSFNASFRKSPV